MNQKQAEMVKDYERRAEQGPIDLGFANGWGKESPAMVRECNRLGHKRRWVTIGRCLAEVHCDACGFKFSVDSSD